MALYAYNASAQVLSEGASVDFSTTGAACGCSSTVANGSVSLRRPGTYHVTAVVSASVQADTAGAVGIQATLNGQAVPGAASSGYSASVGQPDTLVADFLVRVPPCPALGMLPSEVSVTVTGDSVVEVASVTVERLG